MGKNSGKTQKTKGIWKQAAAFILMAVLAAGTMLQAPVSAGAADVTCKELCQAVLQQTGNGDKIEYQSSNARDYGGFTVSDRENVSSIMYLYDAKEVYSICVAKASKKSGAKQLLRSLRAYKRSSSDYLSDYSADEQKVLKSAVCGRKGKYVWYIAMSPDKSVNKKGQIELKKAI